MESAGSSARRVVLIGGGHAHVLVLERWRRRAPSGVDVTVISDQKHAVYSGMIPGVVGGQYEAGDAQIDVAAEADKAGVRFVLGTVERIDAAAKQVHMSGHDPIPFDVASIDVGSTVSASGVPGVEANTVPTRPIHALPNRLRAFGTPGGGRAAVVVGAGAAGVELALALWAVGLRSSERADQAGMPSVTIVDRAERVLSGHKPAVSRRMERLLARRGIAVRLATGVAAVESDCVLLEDGSKVESQMTVWATGASAHAFLRASGLPVDEGGFVTVNRALSVAQTPEIFAAGDCASFPQPLPKAGVYAVRQAEVLHDNILARIEGRALRDYHPQGDYLTLLNMCDGTALATKWGLSVHGRSMWWLKDRIDRGFMRRFHE